MQRNAHSSDDRRARALRAAPDVRRARARPRARHRPLPHARGARRRARRDARRGGRVGDLADVLRRRRPTSAALAEVAHARGVALIVDEAWGAHMAFHEALPEHALARGRRPRDLEHPQDRRQPHAVGDAAPRRDGADGLIGEDAVDRAVTLTESTSPSALLCGVARRRAPPGGGARARAARAHDAGARGSAREQIRAIDGLDVLDERLAGRPGVFAYDPLRLAVDVRGVAATGYELAALLREIDDINLELVRPERARRGVRHGRAQHARGGAARAGAARGGRGASGSTRAGSRRQLRRAAAVGRARDDPARGVPRRAGGRAGGAGRRAHRRRVARDLSAGDPERAARASG